MPLFSAMFDISKNDNEALHDIDQQGGSLAFKKRPVYPMAFIFALFVHAIKILKLDLINKVELHDYSWIDLVANSLNALFCYSSLDTRLYLEHNSR